MRRRPGPAAPVAAEDLARLTRASRRITGLLDASTLARRAAREFGQLVGTDASGVSIRESPDVLVTRGAWGMRTSLDGEDGMRVAVGPDSERLIERLVRREGVHGMLGVPIKNQGEVIGVLYGMNRAPGHLGDRARALALEFAAALGPALGAAMDTGRASRSSALAERRRISRDLYESLGPWLVDISDAARRASETVPDGDPAVLADLRSIEAQAAQAASWLDGILHSLDPAEGLPAAMQVDMRGVAGIAELVADFAVLGEPFDLAAEHETVLLAVVRTGLHGVVSRAGASSVLVTLHYAPVRVGVLVEDDGPGPTGEDGDSALASLREELERLDGELVVRSSDGGGTILSGSVPIDDTGEAAACATAAPPP